MQNARLYLIILKDNCQRIICKTCSHAICSVPTQNNITMVNRNYFHRLGCHLNIITP